VGGDIRGTTRCGSPSLIAMFIIGGSRGVARVAAADSSNAPIRGGAHPYVLFGGTCWPVRRHYYWWPKMTGRLLNESLASGTSAELSG